MEWSRKPGNQELEIRERDGVCFLAFPALDRTGVVKHAFSTRLGGVSRGVYATMNFGFTRGDDPAHVIENYHRMAHILGVEMNRMVLSHQTHTVNVRRMTEADAGKGIVKSRDYADVDGLITDVPGLTLVTFFADCVPLYFVDPVRRVIGLSHSGWRGTVKRMGQVTLERMREEYGTDPADAVACIGPSICGDCYEVGGEVVEEFAQAFSTCHHDRIFYAKSNGKYQLDLWAANRIVLEEAGVKPGNIHVTDICTHCNPQLLFSHRTAGEARGNLAAFLALR